jgi:TonB-dependent receptor
VLLSIRLLVLCCSLAAFTAVSASAQEAGGEPAPSGESELAPTLEVPTFSAEAAAGMGTVNGLAFDETTGTEMLGVEATLIAADGSEFGRSTTDATGAFQFDAVPAGTYSIRFEKPGYRTRRLTEFAVVANQVNPGNIALQPESAAAEAGGVEEIVITGVYKAPVADRPNADEFINTLDTAEIGKFAASDIGDAIKRIPGINVVEGQFAIIRGLEDRYSSTLYNSAPVPSPDPDSQSVQLDLFPSEIASNLVVAKTFAPELPSNSSGGSINILSHEYPESAFEFKLGAGSGFNSNARERFIGYREGSPIGASDRDGVTEGDFSAALGGRTMLAERELRFKAAATWELDYGTKSGARESREPRPAQTRLFPAPPVVVSSGDLSLGALNLTGGRFRFNESDRVAQLTSFLDVGFDLDTEARHRVDFSAFYTKRDEEVAQLRENGFLPGFDYSTLAAIQAGGSQINPNSDFAGFATNSTWVARSVRPDTEGGTAQNGPAWFANFAEGRSFDRKRDLLLFQLNGEHEIDAVEGLSVEWAGNYAETSQDDEFFAARFFFEPTNLATPPATFPATVPALGAGQFAANDAIFFNTNEVDETQKFARIDAEYERDATDWLALSASAGFWFERSEREISADFLETPTVGGVDSFALFGASPQALGDAVAPGLDKVGNEFSGIRASTGSADREILAWNLRLKATLFEDFDLLAGARRESIEIASNNDPFTGEAALDGSPAIYPTKYLMFDRLDNPARSEVAGAVQPGVTFNDQILGIDVPVDPVTGFVDLVDEAAIRAFTDGRIDEKRWLPSAGATYRAFDGFNARLAYSQTVARPSFRELGYYVSVEPGTDDLIVGNPQLELSDVESWDVRAEYLWGDFGDLVAISAFTKNIARPIESIILRDPTNFEGSSSAQFRTFFNNENEASLWGVEAELRKAIDFVGPEVLQYFSVATNFTWIDAKVDRSAIERQRADVFFGTAAGDEELYAGLSKSRRLFSQPEWIVNADVTFDHPDWGTKVTLALFAISDVLDAAGSATLNPNGNVVSLALDRYVDSFHQLDLIASQSWSFEKLPGEFTFKASLKNLSDSTRRLIYDPHQTAAKIAERTFTIGRDLSVSVSYERSF